MTNPRVIGVRSVELGVPNLAKSMQFYRDVWGLTEVSAEAGVVYLRGTGLEHHVLALREQPEARLMAVHMAAPDRAAVEGLAKKAEAFGTKINGLSELPGQSGGGFGFRFSNPRRAANEHIVGRASALGYDSRSIAADENQPCRAQQCDD